MGIFGVTIGHNEADRYLESMLVNTAALFDEHFFYDDQSDDATVEVAAEYGCTVVCRPDGVPSFHQNEAMLRQVAWWEFEAFIAPSKGDWVLVLDCDEVPASRTLPIEEALGASIANAGECAGVMLDIPEVFGHRPDLRPLVRTDRLWGTIHAPRLFPWRQGGAWPADQGYGVPAVPLYVMGGPWSPSLDLVLMHYGYAEELDRKTKYERYHHQQGHNKDHVESILAKDSILEPWSFEAPQMCFGRLTKTTP